MSIPFLFQGQYYDYETGLAYNRFRYYDPELGRYISQDPIRLASGTIALHSYVEDSNSWIDVLGLVPIEKLAPYVTKTKKIHQGVRMYSIIKKVKLSGLILNKGDYFYLDNFHKDHIEIFSGKDHSSRGVLNLDGSLNADKSEKAKRRKGPMYRK